MGNGQRATESAPQPSTAATQHPRSAAEVTVEAVAWVTRFVGGDGTSRRAFREELLADDTVRTVLRRLSARFPALEEALWDPATGEMAEHVQVMVNNTLVGGDLTLDSRLAPGDTVTLVGQFMGG